MFCKKCGSQLPENAKFCKNCGAVMQAAPQQAEVKQAEVKQAVPAQEAPKQEAPQPPVKMCAKCGSQLPENAKFCKNCGAVMQAAPRQAEMKQEAPRQEAPKQEASQAPVKMCPKCGSSLPINVKYCRGCGATVSVVPQQEVLKQAVPQQATLLDRLKKEKGLRYGLIAAAALLFVIVGIAVFSSGNKSSDTYNYASGSSSQSSPSSQGAQNTSGSQKGNNSSTSPSGSQTGSNSGASSSGSQTGSNINTSSSGSQSTSSSTEQKISTYSTTTSQGERLEVEPGYSYVAATHVLENSSGRSASILIPTIFSYAADTYTMGSESEKDGYYELVFKTDGKKDIGFATDYVSDLSKYGFTLEKTINISSNQVLYLLNYNGNITHGAASWVDTTYDMSVSAYSSFTSTIIYFDYPKEVGFDLGSSGSDSEYSSVKVSTDYSLNNDKHRFNIRGWGSDATDCITLSLQPGSYSTGDILKKKDFEAQSGAGQSALCNISIGGKTLGKDGWSIYIDSLDKVEVKILESSDSCLAVSYYIEAVKGSSRYTLEGVCAAELAGANYAGGYDEQEQNYPLPGTGIGSGTCSNCGGSGRQSCNSCHGAGFTLCHQCGGDGLNQCTSCHGTGLTTSSYGSSSLSTCTRCHGHGTTTCSSCNSGRVRCNSCGGLGTKSCSFCAGTGKR